MLKSSKAPTRKITIRVCCCRQRTGGLKAKDACFLDCVPWLFVILKVITIFHINFTICTPSCIHCLQIVSCMNVDTLSHTYVILRVRASTHET